MSWLFGFPHSIGHRLIDHSYLNSVNLRKLGSLVIERVRRGSARGYRYIDNMGSFVPAFSYVDGCDRRTTASSNVVSSSCPFVVFR